MELTFQVDVDDLPYEEDVMNNRYNPKAWLRYLHFKRAASAGVRNMIYERALKFIPGSYKLWFKYLAERKAQLEGRRIDDPMYEALNSTFERALTYMHKYPAIWLAYFNFLQGQYLYTQTRRAFDRALQCLPITQHERIWPLYIKFIKIAGVPETAIRVFRRYLKFDPTHLEDYIDFLESIDQVDEAAKQLANAINDEHFNSIKGVSKHDMWLRLTDLASKNPDKVTLKVEALIRSGLKKFTNEVGRLWTALADYYIRLGNFDKARDVYEEGINAVINVRDFTQIWDAYSEFEYGLVQAKMGEIAALQGQGKSVVNEEAALEMDIARYEELLERQPILISDVFLRQNPHNCTEWLRRVKLFEKSDKDTIAEFTRALKTVDPEKATGKLHFIWIEFAKFWETRSRLAEARRIFEKAVQVNFRKLDHLATVWCEFVEMELRNKNFQEARILIQRATTVPPRPQAVPKDAPTPQRIFKAIRLWSLYADLEESLGTFLSTKAVYEQTFDLRIAAPATVLNYAQFLEDNRYFEDSYKVFERGVGIFKFPVALDIWVVYLRKFMNRYEGTKLERLRDLFEQAVESAPPQFAGPLYVMYAEAEEKYGLARHAMLILDRAVKKVDPDMQPGLYNIYLSRAAENFGVTRTRQIFDKALEGLEPKHVRPLALRYARVELRLGEIDRARAIFTFTSQFCPPTKEGEFWHEWKAFEVKYGSVDTVREMFRVKRSVATRFASVFPNFVTGSEALTAGSAPADKMQALEQKVSAAEEVPALPAPPGATKNVDEIDLDEPAPAPPPPPSSDAPVKDEDVDEDDFVLKQKAVPKAVFGSAADELEAEMKRGAKERLKKKI